MRSVLSLMKAGFTQEGGLIYVSCILARAILLIHMFVDKPTCSVLMTCARNTFFKQSLSRILFFSISGKKDLR